MGIGETIGKVSRNKKIKFSQLSHPLENTDWSVYIYKEYNIIHHIL